MEQWAKNNLLVVPDDWRSKRNPLAIAAAADPRRRQGGTVMLTDVSRLQKSASIGRPTSDPR